MVDDRFAFSTSFDVRWRDLDALARVNNAVYFTYLEHGRVHYLRRLGLASEDPTRIGIIMAEATCRYLSPLRLAEHVPDVLIRTVHIRIAELRNSSFTFEYAVPPRAVSGSDGRLAATASTVTDVLIRQVCYDYEAARPIRIPRDWRERITRSDRAFEPALRTPADTAPAQETTR